MESLGYLDAAKTMNNPLHQSFSLLKSLRMLPYYQNNILYIKTRISIPIFHINALYQKSTKNPMYLHLWNHEIESITVSLFA